MYWSAGTHLFLLLFLIASPHLPFGAKHFQQEKVVWVQLPKGPNDTLGSSVKKSEGLPKSTIEEQKRLPEIPTIPVKPEMTYKEPETPQPKPEPKPEPKKAPPPKPLPDLPKKPTVSKQQKAVTSVLDRLAKEVAERGKSAPPEAAQIPETQPGGFTFGSATAQYVPISDPEYVIYQAKIRKKIMDEWIIPLKYADPTYGLIAKIVVHINEHGAVTETEWEQKSGNESFDQSALRSVEKASPLPPPTERLKWEVLNEGFIVEFRPQNAKTI